MKKEIKKLWIKGTKMKKEIKKLWISALRSGRYRKTKEALKDRRGYCVLGVLTDLYLKATDQKWDNYGAGQFEFAGRAGQLPDAVVQWAGLDSPEITNPDDPKILGHCLSSYNDGDDRLGNYSFNKIAELIAKHL